MTYPSSHAGEFSEDTCNRLTGLLLRASALDAALGIPAWLTGELESLADRDPAFEQWLQSHFSSSNMSVAEFCRSLVRRSISPSAVSDAAQRLHDCAFVVLRLAGLSLNVDAEMQSWQDRQLYNLAYGLSHELNNPLANIVTRASVLAQRSNDAQTKNLLQTIVDSAHRGREMLGDLMTLARPPAFECQPRRLQAIVREMIVKIRQWCEARQVSIELLEDDDSQDCEVSVDIDAMREVLWGLVRNSLEAMPQGGRLSVCSYRNPSNRQENVVAAHSLVSWGVIEISDTGPGLSAIALKNCFDPFYSGREAGRGLGLGLSKAKAWLHRQHGLIELENLPAQGCRVTLWLPSVSPTAQAGIESSP